MQISKSQVERIVLWVLVAGAFIWLLALTVMMTGELQAINEVLAEENRATLDEVEEPFAAPSFQSGTKPQVGIAGVQVVSGTLAMTVTVRFSGAGDLLYEAPVLADGSGRTYPITADSLSAARFAFLDLVTGGQATARMVFAGAPAPGRDDALKLVFNPHRTPGDAYVAPRVEVIVPVVED